MRLVLLGVRGSTPAPGAPFVRYGGHTSCVAVLADAEQVPSLVLDAGTGLRDLPGLTGGEPFRGTVVLSHLHWDHVQGLPFCRVLDHPRSQVDLYLPVPGPADDGPAGDGAAALLARSLAPPHFPIGPEGLRGSWRFRTAGGSRHGTDGPVALEGATGPSGGGAVVTVARIPHKGGPALGIRVQLDGASLAYLPDHALVQVDGADPTAEALVAGADLLLHDGQYTEAESRTARAYGHATLPAVMALADRCRVGRLVLTHHDPNRDDDELDALAAAVTRTPGGRSVRFARQGQTLAVRPAPRPADRVGTGGAG